ncbi:hypothetical protein PENTCL1PPCAC_6786, partial [Pristionchus entomophagus]
MVLDREKKSTSFFPCFCLNCCGSIAFRMAASLVTISAFSISPPQRALIFERSSLVVYGLVLSSFLTISSLNPSSFSSFIFFTSGPLDVSSAGLLTPLLLPAPSITPPFLAIRITELSNLSLSSSSTSESDPDESLSSTSMPRFLSSSSFLLSIFFAGSSSSSSLLSSLSINFFNPSSSATPTNAFSTLSSIGTSSR